MLGCGIPLIGLLGTDCVSVLSGAIYVLSALAARLYYLPATVAVVAALSMGLTGWEILYRKLD